MQVGILNPYNKKQYEEATKKGKNITLGVDVESILDDLNYLEIKHRFDTASVLAEFKQDILIFLGKLEVKNPEEGQK